MDLYKLDKIFWTPLRWFVLNCIRYNFLKISVFFIIFFTKQLNDIINFIQKITIIFLIFFKNP